MRVVKFNRVNMEVDRVHKTIQAFMIPIEIDLDMICAISPAQVPSEVVGPSGETVMKLGTSIFFPGHEVIVDLAWDETKKLWLDTEESGRDRLKAHFGVGGA